MSLIKCPDCDKSISDAAPACIGCGRPMIQGDHKPEPIFKDEKPEVSLSISKSKPQAQLFFISLAKQFLVAGGLILTLHLSSQFLLAILSPPSPTRLSKTTVVNGNKAWEITGYDSASNSIIDPINVFKDYENRNAGISGKARHGERITILEKSGNGVKIKTSSGVTGWVSNWFVKEI